MPNATVLGVACVVLMVEPAQGRIVALVGGLAAMLAVNIALMRRSFMPLSRLAAVMRRIDPLHPGERVSVPGPASEVTLLAESFNDMLDRLEAERRDSARRTNSAQEAERRRLAIELHDQIGQNLTALAFQLDRLAVGDAGDVRAGAADAREAALGILDDVRDLARALRPQALDLLGLEAALAGLADRVSKQTGLPIAVQIAPDLPPVGKDAELVVYRVAQESLTNVVRHAQASGATLSLHGEDGGLVLRVRDDGIGLRRGAGDDSGGIRFMRERAVVLGGSLRIGSAPGGGTEVELRAARDEVTA